MTFLLFAVALFGLCYVVGHSQITMPVRRRVFARWGRDTAMRCSKCAVAGPGPGHWSDPWMKFKGHADRAAELFTWECPACQATVTRRPSLTAIGWSVTLLECPACLSFWAGLAVAVWDPAYAIAVAGPWLARPLPFAMLACGSSALLGLWTRLME